MQVVDWKRDDIDDVAVNRTREEAAAATAAITMIADREELRSRIQASQIAVSRADVLAAVGIGILGAIPATTADERLGEWLAKLPGMDKLTWESATPTGREAISKLRSLVASGSGIDPHAIATLPDADEVSPLFRTIVETASPDAADPSTDLVESLLLPEGDDIFGAALTRFLSDRWVNYRGWHQGTQAFHEFKALCYGTTAIVSLPLDPNPMAIGLSAWHLVRAMLASRDLSKLVIELADAAIAEGRLIQARWDAEVASSALVDAWVGRAAVGYPVSDSALLDAFSGSVD